MTRLTTAAKLVALGAACLFALVLIVMNVVAS